MYVLHVLLIDPSSLAKRVKGRGCRELKFSVSLKHCGISQKFKPLERISDFHF
jgi:hypothetical protein